MLSASTGPTSGTSSKCGLVGRHQRVEAAEMAREVLAGRLADMADAQREDETGERRPLARLDRGHDVGRRLFGHPLEPRERLADRAGRCPPACARARRRPAGRRASRRGPRCRARGGPRNAAAPACAARGRRARRCSARSPRREAARPPSRIRGSAVGITNAARVGADARARSTRSDFRNHVAGAAHDDGVADAARPCAGPRPRCAASRW